MILVVLAHSQWFLPAAISHAIVFRAVIGNGQHGVAVFFVISGYLITTLLLRERQLSGKVSLLRFYFRRTLRIFPPFYVFLLVMGLLWLRHIVPEEGSSFIAAATYSWALDPKANGYFLTHTWSLSVEEIFYLAWPLVFLRLHTRDSLRSVTVVLIFAMPLVRLLLYFSAPALRGHEFYMVQGWIDTMMGGCWLALFKPTAAFERFKRSFARGWIVALLCFVAFYASPVLIDHLPKSASNAWALLAGPSLVMSATVLTVCYTVEKSRSLTGKLLNLSILRWIGMISYSLYIWQQIFMSQRLSLLPWGYLYALAAAAASYWLVEKPSFRLRSILESRSPLLRH